MFNVYCFKLSKKKKLKKTNKQKQTKNVQTTPT